MKSIIKYFRPILIVGETNVNNCKRHNDSCYLSKVDGIIV